MDTIDTIVRLHPDGRPGRVLLDDQSPDGDGLWLYWPRDPTRPPVLIQLARLPRGAMRVSVVEAGDEGGIGPQVHHLWLDPRRSPFAPVRADTPPVPAAAALAAATRWADRASTP